MNPELAEDGRKALETLDRVLNERPHAPEAELVGVTRFLVRLRDELIEKSRADTPGGACAEHLERANSILSLLVGSQYPLVGTRWERMEKTREALVKLLPEARGGRREA